MKKTIIDLFESSVEKYGAKTFLLEKRHHKFEPTTYAETRELALETGAGLAAIGIRPKGSAQRCEPTFVICCGVRIPATTSSPCALIRYSPLNKSSPVPASRLKQTPVAEVSPILPNTIACTLTAVPHSSGILSILRYRIARSFIQELNTAQTAPHNCS